MGGGLAPCSRRELDRLEEERLALKTENRKLAQQCGARAAKLGLEPGLDNAEDVDDDGVLKDILVDNLNEDKNAERDSNDDDHVLISGDLEALQEYGEALRRRRQAMGGRQDEVIKQHEGNVMMQKDLEAAREEVARMAKEAGKASQREEELKEEVEKLRQGMHQILESVREQVLAQLYRKLINFVPGWSERCDGDSTRPRDPPDHSRRATLLRGVPAKHGA